MAKCSMCGKKIASFVVCDCRLPDLLKAKLADAVCRGGWLLGNNCGTCGRCRREATLAMEACEKLVLAQAGHCSIDDALSIAREALKR